MTDQEQIADPIEAVASAYLSTAERNPSLALHRALLEVILFLPNGRSALEKANARRRLELR